MERSPAGWQKIAALVVHTGGLDPTSARFRPLAISGVANRLLLALVFGVSFLVTLATVLVVQR